MRVSRKKCRNPLEPPWWAIKSLEWVLMQSKEYMSIDDILIQAWTQESDDQVYVQFLWPGGRPGLLSLKKDTPRDEGPERCPYFRGVGTCESRCYSEPSCQTDRPEFGWPAERYKF